MLDKSRFFKQLNKFHFFFIWSYFLFVPACNTLKNKSPKALSSSKKIVELPSIKISDEEWSINNLNVNMFANGDTILHAKTDLEWSEAGRKRQAAWCYYNNDSTMNKTHGKLYNWYAISDPRGLAPEGWRVATEKDWSKLSIAMGGIDLAGAKMMNFNNKEFGLFAPKPSGFRLVDGNFYSLNYEALWWSSTSFNENFAWSFALYFQNDSLNRGYSYKDYGLSVRCIKEK